MFGERTKLKVVQNESVRSDEILDENPINREIGKDSNSEDLDQLPSGEVQDQKIGLRDSLAAIFSWKNYKVFLITAFFFNSIVYLDSFFNLYLWTIVPNLIFIGGISTIAAIVSTFGRFFGGYIGDRVNRKSLAVVSMLISAVYSDSCHGSLNAELTSLFAKSLTIASAI